VYHTLQRPTVAELDAIPREDKAKIDATIEVNLLEVYKQRLVNLNNNPSTS